MNKIAEEIKSYFGSSKYTDEEFIEHYGTPQRFPGDPTGSGRYREGSGQKPLQHGNDFLSRVEKLKSNGWKETPENIKNEFGLTTSQYRIEKSICLDERKAQDISRAKALKIDGKSTSEIGRIMGVNESTVRGWFDQEQKKKYMQARETADFLKKQVDKKKMIDVGKNAEKDIELSNSLNISREKLDTALYLLEREGYHVYKGRVPQVTNKDQMTTLKVLAAPDVQHKEIYDYDKIQTINEYISRDGGKTYEKKFNYPASMDSKRIKVILKNEIGPDGLTGEQQDGLMQIRRNVPDLDLKGSRYAQVRILVDGDKYLKGMAVYSDNIPEGYDIVFNSNKKTREDAFKPIKKDPDNPFGATIKDMDQGGQYWYVDKNGKKKLGLINKKSDEGDWTEWQDTLPSQFLAKQNISLAKKQLNLAKANKEDEYEEIMSLNNPTLKKYYLKKFADSCDSAAVDLKAASLPGQKYHVIIPINTLKEGEVYAPQYENGTELALIRYPHAGTFEIPVLKVNNKNQLARKVIGTDSIDAVGITKKVADRLSGADFDGDTVMVIPTNDKKGKVRITSTEELKGLKNFDTKTYQYDDIRTDKNGNKHYYRNGKEFKVMKNTNTQMGIVSNLITDMTIQGATNDELARAVRHSMVVIDAEKHSLDYKQSYLDNNIAQLQKKYQPKFDKDGNIIRGGGASTIFSRAKGQIEVPKRRGQARINMKGSEWYDPSKPEGSLIYLKAYPKDLYYALDKYDKKTGIRTLYTTDGKEIKYNTNNKEEIKKYYPVLEFDKKTGEYYFTNKGGGSNLRYKTKARTIHSTRMAETDDAYTLISKYRNPKEIVYAEYANAMKALANKARKSYLTTPNLKYDPQAKKIYAEEVSSLEAKLNNALKNSIRERTAQRYANAELQKKKKEIEDLKPKDEKKMSQQAITKYRQMVGSVSRKERNIKISDREWQAIQAGAISENKLIQILSNSDPDSLRERAMPKQKNTLSRTQIIRIHAYDNSNFTIAEIAKKMGVSPATVSKYLKGDN